MTKSRIQEQILKHLKSLGVWCWAFNTEIFKEQGVPDIICCYRGRFVGVKIKNTRGKVTGAQRLQLKRRRMARGRSAVVRSVEDVKGVLEEIDKELDGECDP